MFLTFGTAQGVPLSSHRDLCQLPQNPQREFSKERMSVGQIVAMARRTQEALRAVNPGVTIVYTVSPVRYLDEGPLSNSASKGAVLCGGKLTGSREQVYLPVYKYIMDQLRDYRFWTGSGASPMSWRSIACGNASLGALFGRRNKPSERVEAVVRAADHQSLSSGREGYRRHCRGRWSGFVP